IELHCRQLTECDRCHKQASITSGTLFHSSNLPLLKWFWVLYFVDSDKGSILALRLSKFIEVNWIIARLILKKVRAAMGN
ncbi:IS1595 family transposase, partial [Pseudoalteromonas sp. NBT06-2]